MNEATTLELPDELYEVFRHQAALMGKTPEELAAEWMARNGPKPRRHRDDPAHARLWSNCGGMRERLTAVIPNPPITR